jgi:hypothetical protein
MTLNHHGFTLRNRKVVLDRVAVLALDTHEHLRLKIDQQSAASSAEKWLVKLFDMSGSS